MKDKLKKLRKVSKKATIDGKKVLIVPEGFRLHDFNDKSWVFVDSQSEHYIPNIGRIKPNSGFMLSENLYIPTKGYNSMSKN